MTQDTEKLIASDGDLTRLFAGKPTQYRKSKSLPKFTGQATRMCVKINRIFFDDPDEAYRLFHKLVPGATGWEHASCDSDFDANGCRHGLVVTAPIFLCWIMRGFTMAD